MSSVTTSDTRAVKSWAGLFFGLFLVGLSIYAWYEDREIRSLVGGLGFLCFTYPWSQITTLKDTSPMTRTTTTLVYAALVLLTMSMLMQFVD